MAPANMRLSGCHQKAFVAFVILGSFSLDTERRNWIELYRKGIIDKSEYYRNRFNFF